MSPNLISAIQSFTLNSRKLLERETEEQLQGLYGWLPDGTFGAGTALALPEAAETRKQLEAYVAEEAEAGVDAAAARAKLKRETAFTWLNRAVALRLMEERSIIKSTFGKLHKSNAFIYWLTDVKGEASIPAPMPINAMAEGPVDAAYREFLLWQCGELAAEVSVLFDSATLASRLCPRPAVLKKLAEMMNVAGITDAWKAGNEETIGWVYEGFIEDENAEVFEKFGKGKKVLADEIAAATQRFTPRWIVQFLVQNSIGRIWVEMHPDSRLAGSLEYLVPLKSSTVRLLKPVNEITFLDPCCGSMHFGLLAFDIFVEMYREERENAGKPGWPETSSAATEEEIPGLILAHNLHGIDIDLRAVQVSALALMLKARTLNPKATVTDANLACANVEQLTGGRLDAFISATPFSHPIYERILRRLASRLKDSDHLGSLLRIEVEIQQLVEVELKKAEADQQFVMDIPGFDPEQFQTQEGIEEFFAVLTDQIGQHLDHFVLASRSDGKDASLFAREAAKGLRFLRLVERRYDVVATNPPYLSRRNMSEVMAKYLDEAFKSSKGDLYAACIMRCVELADPLGLVAMVTQQSFMFISSYEDMRADLRKTTAIEGMAHLGPRAFPNIAGEKVNTTAFVLRREPEAARRDGQVGTYFRLVKERDADAKRLAFESTLTALRHDIDYLQVSHYQQSNFDAIPGKPWVYWIPKQIRKLFLDLPAMASVADIKEGINTGDNFRFMRLWWEINRGRVGREETWARFAKGNRSRSYVNPSQFVVRNNLEELRTLPGCAIRNIGFSFRSAVGFLSNSSSGFCAWVTPEGHLFCSTGGRSAFPNKIPIDACAGLMNSKLFSTMMSLVNPTITVKVGDVTFIPIPAEQLEGIAVNAREAIHIATVQWERDESSYLFVRPNRNSEERGARNEQLATVEAEIDAEVSRLYGLSEEDLAAIDRELSETVKIGDDEAGGEVDVEDPEVPESHSPHVHSQSWLSYALGTVLGRFEIGQSGGLGCGDFPEATVAEIRKLIDPDGIMPCDAGHPQDIAARAVACLELMLGAAEARATIRSATVTEGDAVDALRGWLDRFTGTPDRSFWKYHHQLYRKRPVYWPFQSPKKNFTFWVFHEKLGPNTLHTLKELTDVRLNLLEREIADLLRKPPSRVRDNEQQKLLEMGDDLREFSARLKIHIDAGYASCIDDGVLLNAAPLHDLFPSWTDTAAAWKELEKEKYEWAHQAMRHWPDRVTEACRSNRSFAIAHNLEHLCPAPPPKRAKKAAKKAATPKDVPESGTFLL